MPETMKMPVSLHVPKLYEGGQALIHWKPMMGATGYTLECSTDDPFESACRGISWDVLADGGMTWADLAEQWDSWEAFEQLPAKGHTWQNWERQVLTWQEFEAGNKSWKTISELDVDFTVYIGPGFNTPAPDQGWRWTDYDHAGLTWGEIDAMTEYTWHALLFLPPTGLIWSQLDSEEHTWAQLASLGPRQDGYTWSQWALLAVRGLTWDSLDARCLNWAQFEGHDLSWSDWEWLPPDIETHKGCFVEIPPGRQSACFRLRAHNENSDSEYLTTARRPIVTKEDLEVSVKAGQEVSIQLDSDRVWSFEDAEFTVLQYAQGRHGQCCPVQYC